MWQGVQKPHIPQSKSKIWLQADNMAGSKAHYKHRIGHRRDVGFGMKGLSRESSRDESKKGRLRKLCPTAAKS